MPVADIDMIPRSYRDGVRLRRALRLTAGALALVIVGAAAGHAALRWSTAGMERKAIALRTAASAAQSDLAHAATEAEAQLRLQQQAVLLRALRREGELAAFAQAIDGALPADTWLTTVTLRRNLRLAPPGGALPAGPGPDNAIATGNADGNVLLLDSTVELGGQATGYEGVTGFLANLGRAPGMDDVALQSSGVNPADGAIDFRAALVLARRKDAP